MASSSPRPARRPPWRSAPGGRSRGDRRLLLLAGVAAAIGVLTKQAAVDGLVAVGALVLADAWRRRRNPVPRPRRLRRRGGRAGRPRLPARAAPSGLDDWWFAMAGHRTQMDSLIHGLYDHAPGRVLRVARAVPPGSRPARAARRRRLVVAASAPAPADAAAGLAARRDRSGVAVGGRLPSPLLGAGRRPAGAARRARAGPRRHAVAGRRPGRWPRPRWSCRSRTRVPAYTARTADRVSELTSADPRGVAVRRGRRRRRGDHRARTSGSPCCGPTPPSTGTPTGRRRSATCGSRRCETSTGAAAAARATITGPDPRPPSSWPRSWLSLRP